MLQQRNRSAAAVGGGGVGGVDISTCCFCRRLASAPMRDSEHAKNVAVAGGDLVWLRVG